MALYFCKCINEVMFEDHRREKQHRVTVCKQKRKTFCKVCKLQCYSEQMFASHLTGKKHQKKCKANGAFAMGR
nr:unnamed protein product [Digitaria exilis]